MVLTPLLHAASSAIAMGIPTIVCRVQADARFGHLSRLLPIFTPQTLDGIDWSPRAPDVSDVRSALLEHLQRAIQ